MFTQDRALQQVGTVHGGLIMSLTDTLGSLVVASKGHFMTGVSTDINASFVKPAGKPGDTLFMKASLIGMGKSLAYTRVEFTNTKGDLVAYGSHTKYVGKSSSHANTASAARNPRTDTSSPSTGEFGEPTLAANTPIVPVVVQGRISSIAIHASLRSLFDADRRPDSRISNGTAVQGKIDNETGMGKQWIRWMHKHNMRDWIVPILIASVTLIKWCIGLGSYSGAATPPMFGDYEAQRHWMELTIHLPTNQWYTYDLEYWGLDYPPLTAYVSYLCGLVGSWLDPSWFALDKSRGIETSGSKVYMRATVVALDLLIYVPALLMFNLSLLTLFFQPALLLIDSGHFQYNSVMLGLTIMSMNFFARGQDLMGAFCFVMSLGFKQMALYYAPAIGIYLLSKCIFLDTVQGSRLFIRLAVVTIASFILLFLPFLPPFSSLDGFLQSIRRIFPFARGLFEDKVANFWCASNVVFKWKRWAAAGALIKLSTVLTLLGFLPAVFVLVRTAIRSRSQDAVQSKHTPMLPLLPYALLTSSMSFFLFSFQVHEKTILLPLMPLTLLLCGAPTGSAMFSWGVLANNVAMFSMWPLLKRDGLGLQYLTVMILWNRLIGYDPRRLPAGALIKFLSLSIYAAATSLHLAECVVSPPSKYPDIFPVLNVLISTPVFVLVWLWSIKSSIEVSWALGGIGPTKKASSTTHNGHAAVIEEDAAKEPLPDVARRLTTINLGLSEVTRRRAASSVGSSGRPRTAGSGT
ncbi:hypothetical protein ONZ45_g15921 [Pleurotus djamor]|nr:hypothetical protein ONZ45_g15921 [Pleurotus djamor]